MAVKYDMLSDIEHVLQRSDTYIGSIEVETDKRWVYNEESKNMEKKNVTFCPGLEQCFMEIITNAVDRSQDPKNKVTFIKVNIEDDTISVTNNGIGIPIEIHEKHKIYIPEMIFGHMRTSSNYDDKVKRTVGGRNGIGAKAANIFSTTFTITTVCNGTKYTQTFTNNMRNKTVPKITSVKGDDYTSIEYVPDLKAFGMKSLNENDTIALLKKRTIDAAAVTDKKVIVSFNKIKVGVKDFEEYMNLYIGKKSETPRVFNLVSERWSIGFALNPFPSFTHVSFVNGIFTDEGGKHVDHIIDPVINKVTKQLQDKHPDITIKKQYIKDNVIVFVKSLIENPSFNSQTKRFLTTRSQAFGSCVSISDDTIKKICKLGITKGILDIAKAKDNKALQRIDGKKKNRITGIPKLDDANKAGGTESLKCTLILTEGDSAKATAMAGISVVGRDYYGVFPLKGKLLNVAKASDKVISENEEIININKILGLAQGEQNKSNIRYGKIMIMCDQDVDGSHIKGLLFNYISKYWPNLFEDNFIESLLTPIIKIFKGTQVKSFYNVEDYNQWKNDNSDSSSWRVKYYKGLGTSTAKEAKEYFTNLSQNKIMYSFNSNPNSNDVKGIELAFYDIKGGNSADQRKVWITDSIVMLNKYKVENKPLINYNHKSIKVEDFINKELVQFSIYDNERSIPHVIDGLKPSQRKILYSCIKRNIFGEKNEIKVAQLSGYVSEQTSYHHGEESLQGAIVNMAQDYVGSNNMNILFPNGQFGTIIAGGKDASSPRYIFTYLNDWVKTVFHEQDNKLLNYLEDDGSSIEPEFYVPIIPMILVNGGSGIGTGWSTSIPCFNPKDIVENIKLLINNPESDLYEMTPWYKGFKGSFVKGGKHSWTCKGVYKILPPQKSNQEVEVTELPVGVWVQSFKKKLSDMESNDDIVSYDDYSDHIKVKFVIKFKKETLSKMTPDKLEKMLGMTTKFNTSNMHLFDQNGVIKKYDSPEDIIWEFFSYRSKFYTIRKKNMESEIEKKLIHLSETMRFIKMVIDDEITVFKQKKSDISAQIEHHNFEKIDNSYNHLLNIRIHAFTHEKIEELENMIQSSNDELHTVKTKTSNDMWLDDINKLLFSV